MSPGIAPVSAAHRQGLLGPIHQASTIAAYKLFSPVPVWLEAGSSLSNVRDKVGGRGGMPEL